MKTIKPLTYSTYLNVEPLIQLQKPQTSAHDELQFIVVHQVFELWFKLMIYELETIRSAIRKDDTRTAVHLLQRVHTLVQAVTQGFEIIETMRPVDFLAFRDVLKPASGFQSAQFREIEFMCGLRDERYVMLFDKEPKLQKRLKARMKEPSLWDEVVALLKRRGYKEKNVVDSVIRLLREKRASELGELLEALVRFDELFAIWRQRHVTMTERMIGSRIGTGEKDFAKLVAAGYAEMGQGGVQYLRTTLDKRFFPLLWQARTQVQR
jgi:tryptophan 2,3-dioxygenase